MNLKTQYMEGMFHSGLLPFQHEGMQNRLTQTHSLGSLQRILDSPHFVGGIRESQKGHKGSLGQVGGSCKAGQRRVVFDELAFQGVDLGVVFLELQLPVEFLWKVRIGDSVYCEANRKIKVQTN